MQIYGWQGSDITILTGMSFGCSILAGIYLIVHLGLLLLPILFSQQLRVIERFICHFLAMRNHTQAYTNTMIGDLKDMTKRLEGVVVLEEIIRSAVRRCRTLAASPSDDSLTFI